MLSSDDFFTFAIERTGTPPERLGGSHRFRVTASLAGRPFETFPLDVGLHSPPVEEHDTLTTPDLLAFAQIEPVHVRAVPLERHIAEKAHAYTRRYSDDRPSTRAKDLVDIVLMSELRSFEYDRLRKTIVRLFQMRAPHDLPSSLPVPQPEWAIPYRPLADDTGLDPELTTGHRLAAAFLDPVFAADANLDHWDAETLEWRQPPLDSGEALSAELDG